MNRNYIMKTNFFRYLLIASLASTLCILNAVAQNVTGSITGLVTDPSGAVVSGAKVTAENSATGVKTVVETNQVGAYTLRFLPIGTYTVTVEAKGFSSQKVAAFPLEI